LRPLAHRRRHADAERGPQQASSVAAPQQIWRQSVEPMSVHRHLLTPIA
jgi:hypothetical protein